VEVGNRGYPPRLGKVGERREGGAGDDKKIRILAARIHVDPLTDRRIGDARRVDDPDHELGGKKCTDVYSNHSQASDGIAMQHW